MDFDTLEQLWRSEANDRASIADAYLLETTLRTLKRRRNRFTIGMALIGFGLLVWTGVVTYAALTKIADIRREWGSVAMLVLSWLAFFAAGIQQRRHMTMYSRVPAAMPDVLRALIGENRTHQKRIRLMGIAAAVFVVVLAITVFQLHSVGKMELRHAVQASILFGTALAISTLIHAIRYVRVLKPEAQRLQWLLTQYDTGDR